MKYDVLKNMYVTNYINQSFTKILLMSFYDGISNTRTFFTTEIIPISDCKAKKYKS